VPEDKGLFVQKSNGKWPIVLQAAGLFILFISSMTGAVWAVGGSQAAVKQKVEQIADDVLRQDQRVRNLEQHTEAIKTDVHWIREALTAHMAITPEKPPITHTQSSQPP
jgi:hypothetical protein